MLAVLGLLTGLALLSPALIVLYLQFGGIGQPWMLPFLTFAGSVPMLGFSAAGGVLLTAWSIFEFARRDEPDPPR